MSFFYNELGDFMDDIKFDSLKELYDRWKPALTNKKDELHLLGYKYITEIDIWNYLKDKKWTNSHNLSLYEMVDDIINVENIVIADFYKYKEKDGD